MRDTDPCYLGCSCHSLTGVIAGAPFLPRPADIRAGDTFVSSAGLRTASGRKPRRSVPIDDLDAETCSPAERDEERQSLSRARVHGRAAYRHLPDHVIMVVPQFRGSRVRNEQKLRNQSDCGGTWKGYLHSSFSRPSVNWWRLTPGVVGRRLGSSSSRSEGVAQQVREIARVPWSSDVSRHTFDIAHSISP